MAGNRNEIWRRLGGVVLFCLAVGLAYFVPEIPFYSVRPVDFQEEQADLARGYMGMGVLTEDERRLARLPLEQFVAEVITGRNVVVAGEQWQRFYTGVAATLGGSPPDRDWSRRAGEYGGRVFFRGGEPDIRGLEPAWQNVRPGEEYFLRLPGKPERWLAVWTYRLDESDFGFGSVATPVPAAVLYPYRVWSWGLLATAALLYLLLPWPQRRPELIAYARWRLLLGDLLGYLLGGMFFTMPFFIIANTRMVLYPYGFFAAIFWLLAALGGLALAFNGWYAGLQWELLPDRLRRFTWWRVEEYPFAEMLRIEPCTWQPPRWLKGLAWGSAILSRRPQAAGTALILSGTEYQGMRIVNRDGRTLDFWLTDQLGGITMPGWERIPAALERAGVPLADRSAATEHRTWQ